LLFEDRSGKRWLILEFKNQGTKSAVTQLIEHINQIVDTGHLPAVYSIQGMIISPEVDATQISLLRTATSPGPVHWWRYETELRLVPAPGSAGSDSD
jgi:hypothetical protein